MGKPKWDGHPYPKSKIPGRMACVNRESVIREFGQDTTILKTTGNCPGSENEN